MRFPTVFAVLFSLYLEHVSASALPDPVPGLDSLISQPIFITLSRRQSTQESPEAQKEVNACLTQCGPFAEIANCTTAESQCGCRSDIAQAIPGCQTCLNQQQQLDNAASPAFTLPTQSEYEQACAQAGFPVDATSSAGAGGSTGSSSSSGSTNTGGNGGSSSGSSGTSSGTTPSGNGNTGTSSGGLSSGSSGSSSGTTSSGDSNTGTGNGGLTSGSSSGTTSNGNGSGGSLGGLSGGKSSGAERSISKIAASQWRSLLASFTFGLHMVFF